MDERMRSVIFSLAVNDMNVARTAKVLYMHYNTLRQCMERIQKRTGLNPRRFHDLVKLVEMAGLYDPRGEREDNG